MTSVLLGPAVTPWETTLGGVIGGAANNPSIRLVKYDRTSGVTLDIIQYFLNLRNANADGHANWTVEYRGTEYYSQQDMGTASLNNIAQNLLTDDELFDKYYTVNGVNYDPDELCRGECRVVHFCAITQVDYDAYENCMIDHTGVASSPKLNVMLLIASLLWTIEARQ